MLRRCIALLALVSLSPAQGCLDPIEESRVCGDHGGEAVAANAYARAVYHPCGRECRAGNQATYRCECSRSCPCWDYH